MGAIIWSLTVLAALGLIFGVGLGIASKKLSVEVDERVERVRALLPGANCGGCGFPGCDGFAAAVVAGDAEPSGCNVCSKENLAKIGEIMGVEVTGGTRKVARVLCMGDQGNALYRAEYEGLADCKAAYLVEKGFKACRVGCLGLGTCAKVCPFGAIKVGDDRIAYIDEELCTGCGKCVEACPQQGIVLMDADINTYIACRNKYFGKAVTDVCKAGCIGCKMCEKACPFGAITMEDNLPVIDYDKCTGCQLCADTCRRGILKVAGERRRAVIDPESCVGCTLCAKVCPFEAIEGEVKQVHTVTDKCRGCGVCVDRCRFGAIKLI